MYGQLTQAEITGAMTDLLTGVIAAVMIFPLFKIKCTDIRKKRLWIFFFAFLSISSLIGFAAHYLIHGEIFLKIIWSLLYTLMYETVIMLALIGKSVFRKSRPSKKHILYFHAAICPLWIFTVIGEAFFGINTIIFFVASATAVTVFGFYYLARAAVCKNRAAFISLTALIPLAPAAYIQLKHNSFFHFVWDFDHNGIAHILIAVAVGIMFASAVSDIKCEID